MVLPKFYKVVQDQQGNIVPQVLGSVFNHGTAVLASLYQDDAGTVPLANPMTSDAQYGSFKFYVNPGHYDLSFTKPGYTFEPIDDLQVPQDVLTLGTMATQNANAVLITGGTISLPPADTNGGLRIPDIGASDRVGLRLQMANGTNKWNLYADGTASNYLEGALGIHGLPPADADLYLVHRRDLAHHGMMIKAAGNDSSGYAVQFLNMGGGIVGTILCTATTTTYATSSDGRLKHAVEALTGTLETVLALRPVAFRWKVDGSPGVGFIAQEVQPLVPAAVSGTEEAVDAEGRMMPMGMDLSKIVPYLTGAVQALAQQVQALQARVADLEALV